jgi:hypothetical protein
MNKECSTNGGEEKCIQIVVRKARGKDTTRKTKMWVGGQIILRSVLER